MMPQIPPTQSAWRDVVNRHWLLSNIILSIISVSLTLVICEIGFRLFIAQANPHVAQRVAQFQTIAQIDTSKIRFQAHPYLSYTRTDTVLKPNGIEINQRFFSFEKSEGVIRVACLGGSTTMRQYPILLEKYLNALPLDNLTFEVMDFGCDGYTAQESMINYLIRVSDFKPDYVIVHHGVNDNPARLWPNYQHDYAHFRTAWSGVTISDFKKSLIKFSALFTYLLHKQGGFAFELQNNVIKRIPSEAMKTTPTPGSLDVYRDKLIKLYHLINQHQGTMILCPMAYNINEGSELNQRMIEECNQVMYGISHEYDVMLADANPLMRKHPEWFLDGIHVNDNGQYYKTQIYAQAIHQLVLQKLGQRTGMINTKIAPTTIGRDIVITWDFEPEGTQDFHIQVRLNRDEKMEYFGRTTSAAIKSFRWTYDKPEHSPILVEKFHPGPTYGNHYTFRVLAIDPNRDKIVISSQTQEVQYWDVLQN